MKKLFCVLLVLLLFTFCLGSVGYAFAEEEGQIEPVCTVTVAKSDLGDVLTDKDSGAVGDVVTFTAEAYPMFAVSEVKVNGIVIVPDEDGIYSFELIEGENIIDASYQFSQEQIAYITDLVEKAKDGDIKDFFTLKNLLTIISWSISLLMGGGFCITLLKSKKVKAKTTDEIVKIFTDLLNGNLGDSNNEFLNKILQPIMEKVSSELGDIKLSVASMLRCVILMQENTPEARLAIIEELSKANKDEQDLSQKVAEIVNAQMAQKEKDRQDKIDALKALEEQNNKINAEPKEEVKDESSSGRY